MIRQLLMLIVFVSILIFVDLKLSNANDGCVVPSDGQVFTENVVLCQGDYYLPNGVKIVADNVKLDCNGAKLHGNGYDDVGTGIYVGGRNNVVVQNCIISGYYRGISTCSVWNCFLLSNSKIIDNYMETVAAGLYIRDTTGGLKSKNNLFANNFISGVGIYTMIIDYSSKNLLKNNTLISQEPYTSSGGAALLSSNKNLITENKIYGRLLTKGQSNLIKNNGIGLGIVILGDSNFTKVLENNIASPDIGVSIRDSSHVIVMFNNIIGGENGISLSGNSQNISVNSNNLLNHRLYHLTNQAQEILNAEFNYFGTTNLFMITNKISGPVDYCPFLDGPYSEGRPIDCSDWCKTNICTKA